MTPLYREVYYQCSNLECGHSFKAVLEIVQTIRPSGMPNPNIRLPVRVPLPANDDPAPRAPLPAEGIPATG